MEIYRTFIGIPVKVDGKFLETRSEMMEMLGGERISWVDPDNFHVTIRFIGDTKTDRVQLIGNVLEDTVTIPERRETSLGTAGSFGPRKKPRVVWVGFEETGFFQALKTEVDRALELCGIPVPDYPFQGASYPWQGAKPEGPGFVLSYHGSIEEPFFRQCFAGEAGLLQK